MAANKGQTRPPPGNPPAPHEPSNQRKGRTASPDTTSPDTTGPDTTITTERAVGAAQRAGTDAATRLVQAETGTDPYQLAERHRGGDDDSPAGCLAELVYSTCLETQGIERELARRLDAARDSLRQAGAHLDATAPPRTTAPATSTARRCTPTCSPPAASPPSPRCSGSCTPTRPPAPHPRTRSSSPPSTRSEPAPPARTPGARPPTAQPRLTLRHLPGANHERTRERYPR
jgi:hypothetical protein